MINEMLVVEAIEARVNAQSKLDELNSILDELMGEGPTTLTEEKVKIVKKITVMLDTTIQLVRSGE